MWLGLSYGAKSRNDADTTICRYVFKNSTEETFECIDGKWSPDGLNFTNYTDSDIIATEKKFVALNYNNGTGNFAVSFVRPFLSSNENKTNLTASTMDFAWAYGYIFDNEAQLPDPSDEGTTTLDLSLPAIPPSGAMEDVSTNETNEMIVPPPPSGQIPSGAGSLIVSALCFVGLILQVTL
jgi:hypothetical protein